MYSDQEFLEWRICKEIQILPVILVDDRVIFFFPENTACENIYPITTLWANSSDDNLVIFFLIFIRK